jgi:diguanylate cyclase (GGDEF)-like protein
VQAELQLLSSIDDLTGVVNRRTLLVILDKQFGLAVRKGESLAIIYCDLDGLKDVNDRLGHAAGDQYIKTACSMLSLSVRDSDTVGRLGGDEFLVVLPDCDAAGAALIDARIEAAVVKAKAELGDKDYPLSLSRGIATCGELEAAGVERNPQSLIDMADARMYEAKRRRKAAH